MIKRIVQSWILVYVITLLVDKIILFIYVSFSV